MSSMCRNGLTIIQHTILDIILPTTDTFSDINFAISAFSTQNYGIGGMMITPVILNLLFNLYLWKTTNFDTQAEKRYTWIIVLLNLWPQYQILKLVLSIFKNKSETTWKQKELKIKLELSYIEPFVEAIPQYFISLGVYTMLVIKSTKSFNLSTFFTETWSRHGDNEIIKVFGDKTLGISNEYMFPISLGISLLTGIKSVMDYLHNGPLTISSENKYCNTTVFVAKLIYVSTEFLNKLIICWVTTIVWSNIYKLSDTIFKGLRWEDAGITILLIIFVIYVLIPGFCVIAPMARYLGIKTLIIMYLKNPQLLILPFITDLVMEPLNGYKRCCFGLINIAYYWCCPFCCCDACRFGKGSKITISKELSWVKMLYTSFFLAICCLMAPLAITSSLGILIPFYVLVFLGRIAFILVLHAGNLFGALTLHSPNTSQCHQNDVTTVLDISHPNTWIEHIPNCTHSLDGIYTNDFSSLSSINKRVTRCHSFP